MDDLPNLSGLAGNTVYTRETKKKGLNSWTLGNHRNTHVQMCRPQAHDATAFPTIQTPSGPSGPPGTLTCPQTVMLNLFTCGLHNHWLLMFLFF